MQSGVIEWPTIKVTRIQLKKHRPLKTHQVSIIDTIMDPNLQNI